VRARFISRQGNAEKIAVDGLTEESVDRRVGPDSRRSSRSGRCVLFDDLCTGQTGRFRCRFESRSGERREDPCQAEAIRCIVLATQDTKMEILVEISWSASMSAMGIYRQLCAGSPSSTDLICCNETGCADRIPLNSNCRHEVYLW
jgi:hypothetical protein